MLPLSSAPANRIAGPSPRSRPVGCLDGDLGSNCTRGGARTGRRARYQSLRRSLALDEGNFYKTMESTAMPGTYQDVYKTISPRPPHLSKAQDPGSGRVKGRCHSV